MALEIEGKLVQFFDEQTGVSQQSGKAWRKQAFLLETEEQYPKKAVFNSWNETVDALKFLRIGEKIRVSFRIESREFNERWYTDLTAWRIVKISEQPITGTTVKQTPAKVSENVLYEEKNHTENKIVDEIPEDVDLSKDDTENDLPF